MVLWRGLRKRDVAVWGRSVSEVVPGGRRELEVEMGTEETIFGVLSDCRAVYTLRTGALIGKVEAARWAPCNVEPRCKPLVKREGTLYQGNDLANRDSLLEEGA